MDLGDHDDDSDHHYLDRHLKMFDSTYTCYEI